MSHVLDMNWYHCPNTSWCSFYNILRRLEHNYYMCWDHPGIPTDNLLCHNQRHMHNFPHDTQMNMMLHNTTHLHPGNNYQSRLWNDQHHWWCNFYSNYQYHIFHRWNMDMNLDNHNIRRWKGIRFHRTMLRHLGHKHNFPHDSHLYMISHNRTNNWTFHNNRMMTWNPLNCWCGNRSFPQFRSSHRTFR